MYAATTLGIGTPKVEDSQVTFPIVLSGAPPEGVAAMDFRFRYDPVALQPVSAEAGAAAVKAGKRIMANVAQPGEYIIVLFGMSNGTGQAACSNGEVARVIMRTKAADLALWGLGLNKVTASAADGTEIPTRTRPYTGLHSGIVLPIGTTQSAEESTPETDDQSAGNAAEKLDGNGQPVGTVDNPAENVKKNLAEARSALARVAKPTAASTSQTHGEQRVPAEAVTFPIAPQEAEKALNEGKQGAVAEEIPVRGTQNGSDNGPETLKIENNRPKRSGAEAPGNTATGLEVQTGTFSYRSLLVAGIGVLAILGVVMGYVKRK